MNIDFESSLHAILQIFGIWSSFYSVIVGLLIRQSIIDVLKQYQNIYDSSKQLSISQN